jgi:copper(I)-binding protein
LLVCNPEAQAQGQQKAQAQAQALVQDAWARPTVQGQIVGGGYFRIDGGATNDRLLGVSADIAQSVELHTMRMDGDVMRMRQLNSVEVPARQTVEFKPGGMHVMLIGLKTPLKVGNSFPMTLRFEKAGAVSVNVRVLPAPPSAEHQH